MLEQQPSRSRSYDPAAPLPTPFLYADASEIFLSFLHLLDTSFIFAWAYIDPYSILIFVTPIRTRLLPYRGDTYF